MAHKVILDLDLCRTAPALTVEQSEHVAEHIDDEIDILDTVIGVADTAAARYVVSVVSLRPLFAVL